jgi:N-acetylmuramoyl-L-alanine amidase
MMRGISGRLKKVFIVFILVLPGVMGAFAPSALAAGGSVVKNIRYYSSAGYTRVVLDLTETTGYSINRLRQPERLYLDLFGSVLNGEVKGEIEILDGLLKKIRSAQFSKDRVRVVMDLGSIDSYKIFRLNGPPRVVVDIFGREGAAPRPRTVKSPAQIVKKGPKEVKKRPKEEKAPEATRIDIYRVVIDPGHGGRDPGALGSGGAREKYLVLDIAKRVKRILQEQKGYEVILTRAGDKFLELEERTAIANQKNADLFVSIHANANRSRRLRGIETYFLNFTDQEEALEVAARENKISLKAMKQSRTEVGALLASLALQFNRNESLKLANYVQSSLVSHMSRRYKGIVDKGVKNALFYVLFGARMPSVLVEVSYITNKEEAFRLRSSTYREQLARGIARGIKTYLAKSVPVQKIARR